MYVEGPAGQFYRMGDLCGHIHMDTCKGPPAAVVVVVVGGVKRVCDDVQDTDPNNKGAGQSPHTQIRTHNTQLAKERTMKPTRVAVTPCVHRKVASAPQSVKDK